MPNIFYYEDGQDHLFNEQGERVYDPMEGVLTEITDPNIVLETIASRQAYLAHKPVDKTVEENQTKQEKTKESKPVRIAIYNTYTDYQREQFINKMVEHPVEKGNVTKFAKEFNINPRTAERWRKAYEEAEEVPCKKSKINSGPESCITVEHEEFINNLVAADSQLFVEDLIGELTKKFQGFTILKSQLNNPLKNTMLITIKKLHFEPEIRNSGVNLQTKYEWFQGWKDTDLDYTKNYVLIDEAGFHINMRNNWAKSARGTTAIVKTPKTRAVSHSVISAIHSSAVLHVVLKKLPPKPETPAKKMSKGRKGKKRAAVDTNDEDNQDDEDNSVSDVKPPLKGTTTAHFIKFINEPLDIMDEDESLKSSYLVMDNASIHKSKPMVRKIESRGYRVMYLHPYPPELNAIEQFWWLVKGKMKRHRLMKEETFLSRIADACNDVCVSDLLGFCYHSKCQIINCLHRTPF